MNQNPPLNPPRKVKRVAVKAPLGASTPLGVAQRVIGGTPKSPGQAPGFVQGIRPLDTQQALAQATPEQVQALMSDSFALWCQFSGLEVDNNKFDFDTHRYLLPIYMDNHPEVVLIKAAQMGATVYMLLYLLWFCRYHSVKAGLYFPTAEGVTKLSKDRLTSLLRSSKELQNAMSDDTDSLGLKQIENIHGKLSALYMLYLGGQASKDSVPLDVVCFDEVRLVEETDIDQALERISHSKYKIKRFMSTAGIPNSTIDRRFKSGTQHYWHIACNCKIEGFIPSECFPECLIVTSKEVYLRCPKCLMRIHDPQIGNYIAHNPKADVNSYHISQLISKYITPKEIWDAYNKTTNKKEFYNAKLGRPYIDYDNQPVNEDTLLSCVNPEVKWAYQVESNKTSKSGCSMGVDVMAGAAYVVIGNRNADGKKQIVHLEIIESSNPQYYENGQPITPFKRLYELMREFEISVCVIDSMPNYNEAADFARTFPAKVFLAFYGESGVDMVKWHDKLKLREQIKKGSREQRLKWQVTLNRYQVIDYALQELSESNVQFPHPDALVQNVRNQTTGRYEAEPICRTRFFKHLASLVRNQREIDEATGRYKMEWVYTQGDPHFLHSFVYFQMASERARRRPIFTMS